MMNLVRKRVENELVADFSGVHAKRAYIARVRNLGFLSFLGDFWGSLGYGVEFVFAEVRRHSGGL